MPTLHVIGLPWTTTTPEFSTCAYSMKVLKFGDMMTGRSRKVVLYTGGSQNTSKCDEHVPVFTDAEREAFFGKWTPDMVTHGSVTWDGHSLAWRAFNAQAITELQARLNPREDLILLTGGNCQRAIADAFPYPGHLVCEWAVGYEGIFTSYCAFESHAWRHHVYGLNQWRNGRAYDTVIPNFFDPSDFHLRPKQGYLLYLGRLVQRKGFHVAKQIADAVGLPLVLAGPGASSVTQQGADITIEADGLTLSGSNLAYVGPVAPRERAELLAGAEAVLMPTLYVEPFGGVAVEAMLSGTPVIASEWGAFTETVIEGVSGARFSTLAEGVSAVERVRNLDPRCIRKFALDRYSLESVAPQFDRWFGQLDGLWGEGWGALPKTVQPAMAQV